MSDSGTVLRRSIGIVFSDGGLLALDLRAAGRRRGARRGGGGGGPLRARRRAGGVREALLSTEYGDDGVQRRATLELWPDGEDGQPLRGAGTLISSSSVRRAGLEGRDRLLPLVGRGPRGPRPLRDGPARCLRTGSRRSSPTSAAC